MKNVKVEWCENFIKSIFENGGIYTGLFWEKAEKSGLWVRGTYGTPTSEALEKLTIVDSVSDDNGKILYHVFRLKKAKITIAQMVDNHHRQDRSATCFLIMASPG